MRVVGTGSSFGGGAIGERHHVVRFWDCRTRVALPIHPLGLGFGDRNRKRRSCAHETN
jgi:hypothetical protein